MRIISRDANPKPVLTLSKEPMERPSPDIEAAVELANNLMSKLFKFIDSLEDDFLMDDSWAVFRAWLDKKPNPNSSLFPLFRAWQALVWNPDFSKIKLPMNHEHIKTLAEAFLYRNGESLDHKEKRIILDSRERCVDIYEVVHLTRGNSVRLRGTLLNETTNVFDELLSDQVMTGDYLLALLSQAEGCNSIFLANGPVISSSCKSQIEHFKKFVAGCKNRRNGPIKRFEADFFNLVFDLT